MSVTISKALGRLGNGTRHRDFKKKQQHSMTNMMTVFSLDSGKSVRISMAIWDQGVIEREVV